MHLPPRVLRQLPTSNGLSVRLMKPPNLLKSTSTMWYPPDKSNIVNRKSGRGRGACGPAPGHPATPRSFASRLPRKYRHAATSMSSMGFSVAAALRMKPGCATTQQGVSQPGALRLIRHTETHAGHWFWGNVAPWRQISRVTRPFPPVVSAGPFARGATRLRHLRAYGGKGGEGGAPACHTQRDTCSPLLASVGGPQDGRRFGQVQHIVP
ncbi:hypothetical protein SAMN05428978_104810 [Nitrosomonas sp. Nm34]|nr:hypothetical protein SAMN05428978_104810 [Nitrosomonas sp. Nm34]